MWWGWWALGGVILFCLFRALYCNWQGTRPFGGKVDQRKH